MEAKQDLRNDENTATELLPASLESAPELGFDDVQGLVDEKERIRQTVADPLEKSSGTDYFPTIHIGGKRGCGKTRFGKAVAGEVDVADLSYWHADPRKRTDEELDDDSFEEFLKRLLKKAREEAPSFVLVEDGESLLNCQRVLREHTQALDEMEDPVVTAFTTAELSMYRFEESSVLDTKLHDTVYVDVGEPEEDRWKAIFRQHLCIAFGEDGEDIPEQLDYDELYEKAGWCPPSALQTLCSRIRLRAERGYDGVPRQECVEEVAEEVREEMEQNPLAHIFDTETTASEDRFVVEETDVTYEDVGGLDDVIQKIEVSMLVPNRYPDLFEDSNLETTNGLLLHGPPGNGKTLLARALANETDRSFLSVRGPELKNKWFGETERLIRELFETAEENAPSIVFFDEFDAVAPSRDDCTSCQRGPVNMLLTEMDGLEDRGDILFLAATNRPEALDDAVLRPGRIGETVEVTPPDRDARAEIFGIYTDGLPVKDSVTPEWFAERTADGMTGAEIEAVCRGALHESIRQKDHTESEAEKVELSREHIEAGIRGANHER